MPKKIISDQDSRFASRILDKIAARYGHSPSLEYNISSKNGWANQKVESGI